jgi:hypothetical protein
LCLEMKAFAGNSVLNVVSSGSETMNESPAAEGQPKEGLKAACGRDPLYLFACHLEWHTEGSLLAFQELLAALDDPNENVRLVAESLLGRRSPRRRQTYSKNRRADW